MSPVFTPRTVYTVSSSIRTLISYIKGANGILSLSEPRWFRSNQSFSLRRLHHHNHFSRECCGRDVSSPMRSIRSFGAVACSATHETDTEAEAEIETETETVSPSRLIRDHSCWLTKRASLGFFSSLPIGGDFYTTKGRRSYFGSHANSNAGMTSIRRGIIYFSKTDTAEDSAVTREKEMLNLRRNLGHLYSSGDFQAALLVAEELQERITKESGKKSAAFASSISNIALMKKSLGLYDEASIHYLEALQIYENISGKRSANYASCLTNLGVLYKAQAEVSKGLQKAELLDNAEGSFQESLDTRVELTGSSSREALVTTSHLAAVFRLRGMYHKAETTLNESIVLCREKYGNFDTLLATLLNNLGLIQKSSMLGSKDSLTQDSDRHFNNAKKNYEEALEIRKSILGQKHHETIITMYNLAELLLARGLEEDAKVIQNEILELKKEYVDSEGDNGEENKGEGSGDGQSGQSGAAPTPKVRRGRRNLGQ